jgi:UDP-N-acetylmuramate: L-alanyl-gamma-D-glutamyl-meso-diaminopimelate ligase
VDPAISIRALSRFQSVRRRMELRGTEGGVSVWDDFAHHPTAIAVTLAGLRAKVGRTRILAVLEPRSNTMKLGVMKDRLPRSLGGADRVFCYSANLGWDAAAALAPLGDRAACEPDIERLISRILDEVRPGDQVLVMSNGDFGGIHQRLLTALAGRAAS